MSKLAKLTYAIIFLALVIKPFFISGDVYFIPEAVVRSLSNFGLLIMGGIFYILHQYDIKSKEKERARLNGELQLLNTDLTKAYKYIGRANRLLPLLNELTSGLVGISGFYKDKTDKKRLFYGLLQFLVVSVSKAKWGSFYFVEGGQQKNIVEKFDYTLNDYIIPELPIDDKEFFSITKSFHKKNSSIYIKATSDRSSPIRCFFVFEKKIINSQEEQLIQNIVDQTQLLYKYLF